MKKHQLREVITPEDRQQFLKVAAVINSKDPAWVQPLDNDIESIFDPKKNAQFQDGEAVRWVLYYNHKPMGRIAAFYNNKSAALEEQPTGGCGFFECVDNQEAANILFDAARDWLKTKGMEAMDGSVNFGDRLFWWGVLVEGFTMPVYGMNYNQPYYGALFEGYGFQNYFNQHTYLRLLKPGLFNPTVIDRAKRLKENPEYSFRSIKKSELSKVAMDFCDIYNSGWADFEGVQPLTKEHAMQMMQQLKPIIDSNVVFFAYHNDEAIGFFLMIPDLNQITQKFKGKFGIIQKLRLVWQLKIAKSVNRLSGLVFGVKSEYQGKGIEAGLIRQFEIYIEDKIKFNKEQYKTLEMMWVGDFNPVMMRMCEKYVNSTKHKRHVTYRYLFDREKPFTQCPRLGSKRSRDVIKREEK